MKQIIYVSSEQFGLTINVTSDNTVRDLIVLLDLVDRLALPEFIHLVRKPLLLSHARCPCAEPSSCSSGTRCEILSHLQVDLWDLDISQISAFHANTVSCPCDVE